MRPILLLVVVAVAAAQFPFNRGGFRRPSPFRQQFQFNQQPNRFAPPVRPNAVPVRNGGGRGAVHGNHGGSQYHYLGLTEAASTPTEAPRDTAGASEAHGGRSASKTEARAASSTESSAERAKPTSGLAAPSEATAGFGALGLPFPTSTGPALDSPGARSPTTATATRTASPSSTTSTPTTALPGTTSAASTLSP
ncbi:hypothetical protein C7M84_004596 [Penaeus vannamei]|uniref:Uncharacterized protein n=1 Tax=Penaeus vannamei TaxID=6689 RepID=A0A423TJZ5_PENVA|nr:hypothetical protein C7M84_004596 [Penaeus vannamei]